VNTLRYVREDHEGSVAGIENSDGTSYVKESFTAFGLRRTPCTWAGNPTGGSLTKIAGVSREGYTWQRALGSMGLNDMNGRVQDAVTGRFLSPDPYVFEPGDTQGFNRYTYVRNNPLSYVDPSGFMESITVTHDKEDDFFDSSIFWTESLFSTLNAENISLVGIGLPKTGNTDNKDHGDNKDSQPEEPLPEVVVTANRPIERRDLSQDFWPGDSLATCIGQGFAGAGCSPVSWRLALTGALSSKAAGTGTQGQQGSPQRTQCSTAAGGSSAAYSGASTSPNSADQRLGNIITTAGGTTATVGAVTLGAAGAYIGYTAVAAEAAEATTPIAYLSAGLGFGDAIVSGAIAGATLGAGIGALVAIPVVAAVYYYETHQGPNESQCGP